MAYQVLKEYHNLPTTQITHRVPQKMLKLLNKPVLTNGDFTVPVGWMPALRQTPRLRQQHSTQTQCAIMVTFEDGENYLI